jgi:predicted nucleic acid-binding protein
MFDRVVVPQIVYDEVVVAGAGLTGASEVEAATWIEVVNAAPDPTLLEVLDAGEAAAIPLAADLGATLLCDDGDARTEARKRGLDVVGSLGILLWAKRDGRLAEIRPVIERMTELGMFVSDRLCRLVLDAAGEAATEE